jgi:uncharacterized protein (DUF2062 family)
VPEEEPEKAKPHPEPARPGFVERARGRLRILWTRLKEEHATPREIGWAVAIGVFAGCTPAIGVHGWVALALATLFKKNRMWTWIGSRISNVIVLPWIVLVEIQISHRLRTGEWVHLNVDNAVETAQKLLLDWCLGTIPVGAALGALFGMIAFAIARYRLTRRRLAPPPPPSSESPPSA